MGRQKRRGHYCWACDCYRSNESFSGKGHARHVCRKCQNLGKSHLTYQRALRDVERCVTWDRIISRKRRQAFTRFLSHDDERIRSLAAEMELRDCIARLENRIHLELEATLMEMGESFGGFSISGESQDDDAVQ